MTHLDLGMANSDFENPVQFWKINETYGCFSNFWKCDIRYKGNVYPTSEHLYQARKYEGKDKVFMRLVREAKSARDAADLGRRGRNIRSNWGDIRVMIMEQVLMLKFGQNKDVRKILLATGDREIQEVFPGELFWSAGENGEGKNMLGKTLMKVRGRLRHLHGPYTEKQLLKESVMAPFLEDDE